MQTILAVDDEEENLMMVEHTLEDEYHVVAVNSGEMALKYLNQERPDLILLDIKMPQMDGFEVLQNIRNKDELADVPVIFLTSYTKLFEESKSKHDQVTECIGKPFEAAVMKKRIQDTMRKSIRTGSRVQFQIEKKIAKKESLRKQTFIPVCVDHKETQISSDSVMYIEVYDCTCMIKTKHMEVRTQMTIDKLQEVLGKEFIRVDQRLIVNANFIRNLGEDSFTMDNGKVIMLHRRIKEEVRQKVLEKMGHRIQ